MASQITVGEHLKGPGHLRLIRGNQSVPGMNWHELVVNKNHEPRRLKLRFVGLVEATITYLSSFAFFLFEADHHLLLARLAFPYRFGSSFVPFPASL